MSEIEPKPQELHDANAVVNMLNGTNPNGSVIGEVRAYNDEISARINNESKPSQGYHVADATVKIPQGNYESTLGGFGNQFTGASVERKGYEHTFSDKNKARAAQIIMGKAVDIIAPSAVVAAKKKVNTLNEQIERLS